MSGTIRPATGSTHTALLGVGGYRPTRVVTNAEICERIDSSDEWIRTRSGIAQRRWAGPDETVQMMSVAAAGKALATAGVQADQVDAVVVATVSHLMQTPAVAASIAAELGTAGAAAFDISAACAGFCYGVAIADGLVKSGAARTALVIGVERLSDLLDPDDRSSAFLFGDGAGAVLIGPAETPGIGPVVWGTDGTRADLITQRESWRTALDSGRWPHLTMQGHPVFRWASFDMPAVAQQALDAAGVTAEDLDVFVPHQANLRIIDAMARTLHLPEHVVVARDIVGQGNTSAASIPLAIEALKDSGQATRGDLALIIGFGAGLTYGAQVVAIP